MNVLGFDTATELLTIGAQKQEKWLVFTMNTGLKHAETLMYGIDQILTMGTISKKELELIVCTQGPGSFTGLRIGMSTAKGLSAGLTIPFVAVPCLDVYSEVHSDFNGIVIPIIDARKQRFYCALFDHGEKITDDLDIGWNDILQKTQPYAKVLFTGPHAMKVSSLIPKNMTKFCFDNGESTQIGKILLQKGMEKYSLQGGDLPDVAPRYIRKSDAEIYQNRAET